MRTCVKHSEDEWLDSDPMARSNNVHFVTITSPLMLGVLSAALGETALSEEETELLRKLQSVCKQHHEARQRANAANVEEERKRHEAWLKGRGGS